MGEWKIEEFNWSDFGGRKWGKEGVGWKFASTLPPSLFFLHYWRFGCFFFFHFFFPNNNFFSFIKNLLKKSYEIGTNSIFYRVFWLNIAKSGVYLRYRHCYKLFRELRKESEFQQRCCRNSTKVWERKRKNGREKILNFSNHITEIPAA